MIIKRKTASGPRWLAKVYLGVDSNGKAINEYGPTRDTKAKAQEDEVNLKKKAQKKYITGSTVKVSTYDDLLGRFLSSRKWASYSERTQMDYNYWIKKELTPVFSGAKLIAIQPRIIENWLADMNDRMKVSTWQKPYNVLRAMLALALKEGYIASDPCEYVDRPEKLTGGKALSTTEELVTWTPIQIATFLYWKPLQAHYIYPMVVLSVMLGLRPGEVCGVRIGMYDEHSLYIDEGVMMNGHKSNLKTRESHRKLPITKEMYDLLIKTAGTRPEGDFLFLNTRGRVVTPKVYSNNFHKLLLKYNSTHDPLPELPLYNMRHSWSTNAEVVYKVDPKVRAAVMGHTTTRTSDKYYNKVTQDRIRDGLYH